MKKFDYKKHPILGYRMLPDAKRALEIRIIRVLKSKNNELEPTQTKYTKKEIFIQALHIGLTKLEK